MRLLELPDGAEVLDLCCGHGRHAIPLAARGYRMTGYDLSNVFLERARADANERALDIRWVRGDMRELPFGGEFDAVINLFTAFGYFPDDAEQERVLAGVARALRHGGRFLIELIARDSLIRRFQPGSVTRLPDGTLVIEERRLDLVAGWCQTKMTEITPEGRQIEREFGSRVYTPTELVRLLDAAGLDTEGCYGGMDGSALTIDSRRLAIVARKGS